MIKKVLVATDGSESADLALDFALDMAEKYDAEILLLSVFDPPSTASVASATLVSPTTMAGYVEELMMSHEQVLSEALKKAAELKADLKVSTKLVKGRPSDRIVETAREGHFDLIVMGSRGLGGIKETFLGSVSDRVADEAPCPVLIVKKPQ